MPVPNTLREQWRVKLGFEDSNIASYFSTIRKNYISRQIDIIYCNGIRMVSL